MRFEPDSQYYREIRVNYKQTKCLITLTPSLASSWTPRLKFAYLYHVLQHSSQSEIVKLICQEKIRKKTYQSKFYFCICFEVWVAIKSQASLSKASDLHSLRKIKLINPDFQRPFKKQHALYYPTGAVLCAQYLIYKIYNLVNMLYFSND